MAFQDIHYPPLLELISQAQFGFAVESLQREEGLSDAELGAQDASGHTALHLAIQKNNPPLIRLLLKKTSAAQKKIENRASLSALDFLKVASLDLLEFLWSDADLRERLKEIWPRILLRACQEKRVDLALQLIAMKVDVNCVEEATEMTPLHYAAQNDSTLMIEKLLEAGAKQNVKNSDLFLPIQMLKNIEAENRDAFQVFARHGSSVGPDCSGLGLLFAAMLNDEHNVRQFLNEGPDFNWNLKRNQYYALHYTVQHKNEDLLRLLIQQGADLVKVALTPRGPSIFEVAIDVEWWDAFIILNEYPFNVLGFIDEARQEKLLLALKQDPDREHAKRITIALLGMGFDRRTLAYDGEWPDLTKVPEPMTSDALQSAAQRGDVAEVTKLLKKRAPATSTAKPQHAIVLAAEGGRWEVVAAFAEFKPLNKKGGEAYGQALIAVLQADGLSRDQKLAIAKKLIFAGATLDGIRNGKNAVDGAVALEDIDLFRCLMNRGAKNLSAPDLSVIERWLEDETLAALLKPSLPFLLLRACLEKNITLALQLIAKGVDVNYIERSTKKTPLHYAAQHDCAEVIDALLKAGAKGGVLDADQEHPITYLKLNKRLLNRGALQCFANSESIESHSSTVGLLYAAELNDQECVRKFLDHGAALNWRYTQQGDRGYYGYFALHFAVIYRNLSMIQLLMQRGADASAVGHPERHTPRGPSVFEVAIDHDYWDAFFIFSQYQCDVTGLIDEAHREKLLREGVLTPQLAEQLVQINFDLKEILWAGIRLKNPDIIRVALNAGVFYKPRDRTLLETQALSAAVAAGFQAEWESILAAGYLGKVQSEPHADTGQALLDCLRQDFSEGRAAKIAFALEMIKANADLSRVDENGDTALHLAASQGLHELIGPLIRHGADPAIQNTAGRAPFRCLNVLQLKNIENPCRDAFFIFRDSQQIFMYGAALLYSESSDLAKKILSVNPNLAFRFLDSGRYTGMNALQVAATLNESEEGPEIVRLLLQKKVSPTSDLNVQHAILIAVASAAWDILSVFSEFSAKTDADKKAYGQALIQLLSSSASLEDKQRIGRQLILANADLRLVEGGNSALDLARRNRLTDLIDLLQRRGAVEASPVAGDAAVLQRFGADNQNVHNRAFVASIDASFTALFQRYGPVTVKELAGSVRDIKGQVWAREPAIAAAIERITAPSRKFRGATDVDEALNTSMRRDDLDHVLHIVWKAAKEYHVEDNIAAMLREIGGGLCYTGVLTRLIQSLEQGSPLVVVAYPGANPQQLMERKIQVLLAEQFFKQSKAEQTAILLSWGDLQTDTVPAAEHFRQNCKVVIKSTIQAEFMGPVTDANIDAAIEQIDAFPIPKSVHLGFTTCLEEFQQTFCKLGLQMLYQARVKPVLLEQAAAGRNFDALHAMLEQWRPLFTALNLYHQELPKQNVIVRTPDQPNRVELQAIPQAFDLPLLPEIIATRISVDFNVEQAGPLCDALKKLAQLGGRFKALYPSLSTDSQVEMTGLWEGCKRSFLATGVLDDAFEKRLNELTAKEEAVKRGDLLIVRYQHLPFTPAIYEMLHKDYERLKRGDDTRSLTAFVVSLEQYYGPCTAPTLKEEDFWARIKLEDFLKTAALLYDLHECGQSPPHDPALRSAFAAFVDARAQRILHNPGSLGPLAHVLSKLHALASKVCEALTAYPGKREADKAAIHAIIKNIYSQVKDNPACSVAEVVGFMAGAIASLRAQQFHIQREHSVVMSWRSTSRLADALDAVMPF